MNYYNYNLLKARFSFEFANCNLDIDGIKPCVAWFDPITDSALNRRLDQRPPEVPSNLHYPVNQGVKQAVTLGFI